MIPIKDLKRWLATLTPGNSVAIDEGGLTLVEIDGNQQTGSYYEIGGTPEPEISEL